MGQAHDGLLLRGSVLTGCFYRSMSKRASRPWRFGFLVQLREGPHLFGVGQNPVDRAHHSVPPTLTEEIRGISL
ncbi:UNVERIFIED_CONTAM: hypothetical protein Sradi_2036400 [Sesamum radiatum]|uniref:Uncharacterized protein n=1 Tax=Sesamum radiatum TaxID=300843 RepID=A0AAW2TGV1_SESRA